jgi:hypothetical protein
MYLNIHIIYQVIGTVTVKRENPLGLSTSLVVSEFFSPRDFIQSLRQPFQSRPNSGQAG